VEAGNEEQMGAAQDVCADCDGSGQVAGGVCATCGGSGWVEAAADD
jgi:DnaJ-class molecular chaperone